jgi:hypothetical protein
MLSEAYIVVGVIEESLKCPYQKKKFSFESLHQKRKFSENIS